MGFFDAFKPQNWTALAAALGLAPYKPIQGYSEKMCFRRMDRMRGAPAVGESPSFAHWLWGKHRGADVVVLQYETGSGSSSTTWTAAVARIDPPLGLGLEVGAENFFNRLFGGADVSVGHPESDEKLRIHSLDPQRTAMLLSPADEAGRNLLRYMSNLVHTYTSQVGDSFVRVASQGVHTAPAEVLDLLNPAVDLAAWLSARRQQLPVSTTEHTQRREWQRFADANGFQLDAARMTVRGTRDGTLLEIAQEIEGQEVFTAVSARFPSAAPVPFLVSRTSTPNFLQGVFSQDIEVGDPVFDAAFKVVGGPDDAVRQLLRRPGLLRALSYGASLTSDLHVGQQSLFARIGGASWQAANLEMLAAWTCAVSSELVGAAIAPGPYR